MSTQPARAAMARTSKPQNPPRPDTAAANPAILPFNPSDDRFDVPEHVKRRGYRLEWKRAFVMGQPDRSNLTKLQREGWSVVPANRWHDRNLGNLEVLMPKTDFIEVDGLVLMERQEGICQAVETYFHNQTAELTAAKEAALGESEDPKNFPRTQPGVSRTVEGPERVPPAKPVPTGQPFGEDEDFT
jgi:hypothetical protein